MSSTGRRSDPATPAIPPPIDFRAVALCVRHPATPADAPCVLKDFSLEIRRGEQIAVVGASGAGKSTLLATLAMSREPHEGTLEVFGTAPWSQPSAARHRLRRRVFLAPQLPPLPPRQRVVDAVLAGRVPRWTLFTAIRSLVYPREATLAREALARFSLADKLFERVDRLSGGERQRVALARSLVADVDAYLIDEPLSALDPTLAEQALAALQAEAAARGATLVCSLHQVELAHARFPRLVGLRNGRVVFDLPQGRVDAATLSSLYVGRGGDASNLTSEDERAIVADAVPAPQAPENGLPQQLADGSRL